MGKGKSTKADTVTDKDKVKPKQWKASDGDGDRDTGGAAAADSGEADGDAPPTLAIQSESHATPKMLTQYFIAVPMKWRLVTLLGLLRRQMATKYVGGGVCEHAYG